MNEIRVKRMVLAGLAMFLVWIFTEIMLEQVIFKGLFGDFLEQQWLAVTTVHDWGAINHCVNIGRALFNCLLLIWLYASLRPMYGVGTKTALITSAWGVVLGFSVAVNAINLGLYPLEAGLMEAVFETIEFPIAMLAGAMVYEGSEASDRET